MSIDGEKSPPQPRGTRPGARAPLGRRANTLSAVCIGLDVDDVASRQDRRGDSGFQRAGEYSVAARARAGDLVDLGKARAPGKSRRPTVAPSSGPATLPWPERPSFLRRRQPRTTSSPASASSGESSRRLSARRDDGRSNDDGRATGFETIATPRGSPTSGRIRHLGGRRPRRWGRATGIKFVPPTPTARCRRRVELRVPWPSRTPPSLAGVARRASRLIRWDSIARLGRHSPADAALPRVGATAGGASSRRPVQILVSASSTFPRPTARHGSR